jgi:hypothetical protein
MAPIARRASGWKIPASFLLAALCAAALAAWSPCARAEPYLAVQQGFACGQCHVNPTGSGLRNAVGNAIAQGVIPAHPLATGDAAWTGAINSFIAAGGDLRADASWSNGGAGGAGGGASARSAISVEQARVYLGVTVLPEGLLLYLDEQVAPDAAVNREAWGMVRFGGERWYLRAGRMVLPYGLRLQDQQAFIRQVTGINMDTPDSALELGYRSGPWDAQFALSNGTAGGLQGSNGKQYTAQLVRIHERWRLGVSGNFNDNAGQRSRAAGLYAGVRTGPLAWLAETDLVDVQPGATTSQHLAAALLEANWHALPGGNLKFTAEWLEPDRRRSADLQTRLSIVGEYTPIQYLQLRLGARRQGARGTQGTLQRDLNQAFLQLHVYF